VVVFWAQEMMWFRASMGENRASSDIDLSKNRKKTREGCDEREKNQGIIKECRKKHGITDKEEAEHKRRLSEILHKIVSIANLFVKKVGFRDARNNAFVAFLSTSTNVSFSPPHCSLATAKSSHRFAGCAAWCILTPDTTVPTHDLAVG
jgi:hypothetical protein